MSATVTDSGASLNELKTGIVKLCGGLKSLIDLAKKLEVSSGVRLDSMWMTSHQWNWHMILPDILNHLFDIELMEDNPIKLYRGSSEACIESHLSHIKKKNPNLMNFILDRKGGRKDT